jgi:hypothetical protein
MAAVQTSEVRGLIFATTGTYRTLKLFAVIYEYIRNTQFLGLKVKVKISHYSPMGPRDFWEI